MSLAASIIDGNRLALARLLTQIENDTQEGRAALDDLFPHTGKAHLIGITGAPGTGKSSLANQLARFYRNPPEGVPSCKVGIVAVDPSSPFTGGALLGDRVRMRDLAGDPGVFIRSMASRGSLGGLAAASAGFVQTFDAAGFEIILIETVGAGQAEVDIARLAHTTLVIEAPGLGDEIQAIKAGIMEIADILVINKADRPGVESTERALRSMLQLGQPTSRVYQRTGWQHHGKENQVDRVVPEDDQSWVTPIIRTVATEGSGIAELVDEIARHRDYLKGSGDLTRRERARLQAELDNLLQATLVSRWRKAITEEHYRQVLDQLVNRSVSPWQAVELMLDGGIE